MSETTRPFVIDADGHVTEPPTLWEEYLEARFRERAPRFALDDEGREQPLAAAVGDVVIAMRSA